MLTRPHSTIRTLALLALTFIVVVAELPTALSLAHAGPLAQGDPPAQRSGRVLLNPGGYLTAPAAGDALALAQAYLQRQRGELQLTTDDLADAEVTDRYVSQASGLTHIYLRQRYHSVPVHNATINASVAADGRILNVGSGFISDLLSKVTLNAPALTPVQALEHVAAALGMQISAAVVPLSAASGADSAMTLSAGGISRAPIPASLIYVPLSPSEVRLAWRLVIDATDREDWSEYYADAQSGAIIDRVSYNADWGLEPHPRLASLGTPSPLRRGGRGVRSELTTNFQSPAPAPAQAAADGSSYLVFPFPIESPFDDGDPYNDERQQLSDPADALASPFGWHDTNGQAGPEYTITQGNNVHAFEDRAHTDQPVGDEPDGGARLDFSPALALGPTINPILYDKAATVQLFYANNYLHDVLFRNGFDDVAGNFQATNYSGASGGGDAVIAQSQDGGGFVNANFLVPPDGTPGRMQMYLGATRANSSIIVNTPPTLVSPASVGVTPTFGPQSFAAISGDVILASDGAGVSTTDGCQSIIANVSGKIALIDRGNCDYVVKVKNVEDAGAIGVIIADNLAGTTAPDMGGTDATITIPTLSITLDAGVQFKAVMGSATVNVSMSRSTSTRTDGSLDNGVIAHEYAHGLSIRLTGGPSNSGCLTNVEQAGEGWSDYLSMVMTARASDTATTPIAIGDYLLNTQGAPNGIRAYPYSTDLSVNPQTYKSISDPALVGQLSSTYAVGTTWAAMLWEVHWNLVADRGFDLDLIRGGGGNRLALQLVIEGMKIQPCNPTMVEARDAILMADVAMNQGANACRIWAGFAKRGLGYAASGQSPAVTGDEIESYELPPACTVDLKPPQLNVCAPGDAVFTLAGGPELSGPAALSVLSVPAGASAALGSPTLSPNSQATLTISNTGGATVGSHTVSVKATAGGRSYTPSAMLNIANQIAAAPTLLTPADNNQSVALIPSFSWQAAIQAVSYHFELAESPDFASPLIDVQITTTSYTSFMGLRAGHEYFWRVSSLNGCGASAPAPIARFTVGSTTRVLLVDDDINDPNVAPAYAAALDSLGATFTIWNTVDGSVEPPASVLVNYQTIIWDGGQGAHSNITPHGEAELSQTMGSGRCLVVSAPDYYARNGITSFMRSYLGVASVIDDPGQTTVTGSGLLAGLGPYDIAASLSINNFTDAIFPDASATTILTGDAPGGASVAIAKDGGSYRSAYFGLSLDGLGTTGLSAVLSRMLTWCDIPRADLRVAREALPDTALLPGQPFSYSLSLGNRGTHTAAGVALALSIPASLTQVQVSASGLTLTPVSGTPYSYTLADLGPGAAGTLTISGAVSPTLSVDGVGAIGATLSTTMIEADPTNDSDQGLLTFSVPRLRFSSATAYADPGGLTASLQVGLDRVNPYTPVTASYGLVGGAVGGVNIGSGTLSIPAGATATTVGLAFASPAVLGDARSVLVALSDPVGAALGAPAQSTLSGPAQMYLPLVWR